MVKYALGLKIMDFARVYMGCVEQVGVGSVGGSAESGEGTVGGSEETCKIEKNIFLFIIILYFYMYIFIEIVEILQSNYSIIKLFA